MNFEFFNKIEKVLADATMLVVLFAMLLIPIGSVGLVKYNNSEVLSEQNIREEDVFEPSKMPSSAGLPEEFEVSQPTGAVEATQSTSVAQ
jgi:hypothetical protein